ncbi:MAG: hypothetical protein FWE67_14890 [Planctomycetaceae bacterium]|nr:hypothetical protein [Planctomycetaceae bacterium]
MSDVCYDDWYSRLAEFKRVNLPQQYSPIIIDGEMAAVAKFFYRNPVLSGYLELQYAADADGVPLFLISYDDTNFYQVRAGNRRAELMLPKSEVMRLDEVYALFQNCRQA